MKGLLNGAVKLLTLQFTFSNMSAVPGGLFEKGRETVGNLLARRSKPKKKGEQFIAPTPDVSLLQFPGDLDATGHLLVDAFYQMRANASGSDYPVVRFTFASADNVRPEGEFANHRADATKALAQMCEDAMWSAMGFLNPFFQDGKEVEGARSISINCAARNPLVDGNGNPILRWVKDDQGERVGTGPVPVVPKLFLRVRNDDLCVVEA